MNQLEACLRGTRGLDHPGEHENWRPLGCCQGGTCLAGPRMSWNEAHETHETLRLSLGGRVYKGNDVLVLR